MIPTTIGYVGFKSCKDTFAVTVKPGKPHCVGYISEVCKREIGRASDNFKRYSTSSQEELKANINSYKAPEQISSAKDCYDYNHDLQLLKYAESSRLYNKALKNRKHNLLNTHIENPVQFISMPQKQENPLYKSTNYWKSIYQDECAKPYMPVVNILKQ